MLAVRRHCQGRRSSHRDSHRTVRNWLDTRWHCWRPFVGPFLSPEASRGHHNRRCCGTRIIPALHVSRRPCHASRQETGHCRLQVGRVRGVPLVRRRRCSTLRIIPACRLGDASSHRTCVCLKPPGDPPSSHRPRFQASVSLRQGPCTFASLPAVSPISVSASGLPYHRRCTEASVGRSFRRCCSVAIVLETARLLPSSVPPNKRMQPTRQPVTKIAYANLPPVWRAADAGC